MIEGFNCEWKEDRWLDSSRQDCRGGNERMEDWIIFFAWGGSTMCHPPVLLIEDDCAA